MFVVTNVCREKRRVLSRQTRVCRDKKIFLFCYDKTFVATTMMLVVDPAPMIVSCSPEQQQQQQQHLMDGCSTSSGQTVGVMLASEAPFLHHS